MAARPTVIVLFAALLVLALLVPGTAAAGGPASGERGAGGLSAGSGHADAGEADSGTHAAGTGDSSSASRGGAGASVAPTRAGTTNGVRAAPAPLQSEASTAVGDRSGFADGHTYHGGADLPESSAESGASAGGPRPEVTRPAGREYALQSGTAAPRAARAATRDAERSGDPGQGTHHRGPMADPVPYAAPTRPADEQKGPAPGTGEPSAGRGRKDGAHLPTITADGTEVPDPRLLLQFLLVLGFRRVRPGNVLEHPVRRTLHVAIAADPGLDLAGCAAATGANRETIRYHLALLVCCGKVVEETRNGSVRYFPHDPALTPVRRALVHALRNESLAPMLLAIRVAPGISRHELADRLGVAGPSVTRQVQRLIEDGLVESERCGRSTCYRLTPDCVAAFGPSLTAGPDAPASGRVAA